MPARKRNYSVKQSPVRAISPLRLTDVQVDIVEQLQDKIVYLEQKEIKKSMQEEELKQNMKH